MATDEPRFAKGDLNSVMNAHPHVGEWVSDFESRYGTRPIYYGELDRGAKKERNVKLLTACGEKEEKGKRKREVKKLER